MGSRYQCSREAFEQAGYTPEESIQIIQKSVKLADYARKTYLAEESTVTPSPPTKEAFVALSLGPFGSAVLPPQDFDGLYPPPFGPKGPTKDGTGNTRLFSSDSGVVEEEEKAIEALAQFHLWRLHGVVSDPEVWNAVDYVAFETVPHLRELRAIKLAVARFDADTHGGLGRLRGWWVSLVFPGGEESAQWGREEREHQARSLGLASPDQAEILNVLLDPKIGAVPTGLGLNCTMIDQYPSILSSIISSSKPKPTPGGKVPVPLTLVIYPNGGRPGDTFNTFTHRWENDGGPRPDGRNITWEEEVVEVVQKCRDEWKDVIVGGCCRVYPPQIKTLREKANEVL